jgi:hypothetical protein
MNENFTWARLFQDMNKGSLTIRAFNWFAFFGIAFCLTLMLIHAYRTH